MLKIEYLANGETKQSEERENDDYKIEESHEGERNKYLIVPKKEITLLKAYIDIDHRYSRKECVYLNGYQSWTDTREFAINEHVKSIDKLPKSILQKYHLKEYGDEIFKKYEKHVLHGYTFSYIRNKINDEAILFGSLNEDRAYLIINHMVRKGIIRLESDISGRKIKECFPLFDYLTLKGNYLDISRRYLRNFEVKNTKSIKGYTSWYNHYQNISEDIILKNLESIDKESYDLFQIDDGSETFVGDWLSIDEKKFPNGLKPIVTKIHQKGLKAGIWLAPLVCEKDSKLFSEHKDYLYLENGEPVPAGCNWSTDYVLDIRKGEVIDYIKKCLKYYIDLGFDFFKLDFLYASALIKDDRYTRAEISSYIMNMLRESLKGKLLLVCGAQLSSAFTRTDYARVGPDISLKFNDKFHMRFFHRERISTKITLVNTIYRSMMDKICFYNDPDVYLLRDENIKLNKKRKEAVVTINHICGSVYMTSDDVSSYDKEKKELLAKCQKFAGSTVTGIRKKGKKIDLDFENDGNKYTLRYLINKGEIKWIRPL